MWVEIADCRVIPHLSLSLSENFVAEITGEESGRVQIHLASQQFTQLNLRVCQGQQADSCVRLKLDEDVDVAVWAEIVSKNRTQ